MSNGRSVSMAERDEAAAALSVVAPRGRLASGWRTGVAFGILGGLMAWGLFLAFYPVFTVPAELADIDTPSGQQTAALRAAEREADFANAIVILGWTGAILAAALTVGEAWARHSWRMASAGLVGAALAGALFGGAAGCVGHVTYYSLLIPFEGTTTLQGTVLVQIAMLAVLGGGVGLSVGSLAGFSRSAWGYLLGGIVAGALGGMIYPVAVAFVVPAAHTDYVVPRDDAGALFWFMIPAIFLGIIVPQMKTRHIMASRTGQPPAEAASVEGARSL